VGRCSSLQPLPSERVCCVVNGLAGTFMCRFADRPFYAFLLCAGPGPPPCAPLLARAEPWFLRG
jgi:hypothetical protein